MASPQPELMRLAGTKQRFKVLDRLLVKRQKSAKAGDEKKAAEYSYTAVIIGKRGA